LQTGIEEIRDKVSRQSFLLTAHADEEAREEDITVQEIRQALMAGEIIEDYLHHRRGPCCLVYSRSATERDIHVVITTGKVPPRIIIVL
jgi:hypothetical protein